MYSKYDAVISLVVRMENCRYIYIMFIWYMCIPYNTFCPICAWWTRWSHSWSRDKTSRTERM